jgi:anti-sigma B factor antagonist
VDEGAFFAAETERLDNGTVVVKASGELDLSSAPEFEDRIRTALAGSNDLVLDLSELEFIDSTGVHVVMRAFKTTQEHGSGFVITGAAGEVLRAFELVGLVDRLPFR